MAVSRLSRPVFLAALSIAPEFRNPILQARNDLVQLVHLALEVPETRGQFLDMRGEPVGVAIFSPGVELLLQLLGMSGELLGPFEPSGGVKILSRRADVVELALQLFGFLVLGAVMPLGAVDHLEESAGCPLKPFSSIVPAEPTQFLDLGSYVVDPSAEFFAVLSPLYRAPRLVVHGLRRSRPGARRRIERSERSGDEQSNQPMLRLHDNLLCFSVGRLRPAESSDNSSTSGAHDSTFVPGLGGAESPPPLGSAGTRAGWGLSSHL